MGAWRNWQTRFTTNEVNLFIWVRVPLPSNADMAELVDALSSDGSGYAVRVRLSLSAPIDKHSSGIKTW